MPNFDALRSSILGPLEYICRPKLPPAELCGCWPLGVNDMADKSRYGGAFLAGGTAAWDQNYSLPIMATSAFPLTFSLGRGIDVSQDFAVEFMFHSSSPYAAIQMTFGDFTLKIARDGGTNKLDFYAYFGTAYVNVGHLTDIALNHVCIYRKNGVLYAAANGTAKALTASWSATGSVNSATISSTSSVIQGACNVRFCRTGVGTSSSFPVPASLFTGYEVL